MQTKLYMLLGLLIAIILGLIFKPSQGANVLVWIAFIGFMAAFAIIAMGVMWFYSREHRE